MSEFTLSDMNKYSEVIENLDGDFVYAPSEKKQSVSEGDIQALEIRLGVSLPADYREFLIDFGGYAFYNVYFPVEDYIGGSAFRGIDAGLKIDSNGNRNAHNVGMDVFYGINVGPTLDCFWNWDIQVSNGVIPEFLLPIASNGSRSLFLLRLVGENTGGIYLLAEDDAGVPYDMAHFHLISSSFDEFMKALYLVPEESDE